MGGERQLGIDLIRCFAALIVAWYHLAYWSWAVTGTTPQSVSQGVYQFPELARFAAFGGIGVQIFFVISGLVIAQSAVSRSPIRFALARFWRLFPTALICATITLAVAALISWKPPAELLERYLRSVTFFPYGPYIDGVYWTLAVEICFYAVVFALNLSAWPRAHFERIIVAFGCGIAAAWMIQASFYAGIIENRTAELLLLRHAPLFAIGCLIAYTWRTGGWNRYRALVLGFLSIAVVIEIQTTVGASDDKCGPCRIAVFILSLAAIVTAPMRAAPLAKHARAITLTALATYPFYLLHQLCGAALLLGCSYLGFNRFAALAVSIAVPGLVSYWVVLWAEPRLRAVLGQTQLRNRTLEPA